MAETRSSFVLGAGFTGLAAARTSGWPILEAAPFPGGICRSYYVRPGSREPLPCRPADGQAYRFERGGGHWIFGGDPRMVRFLENHAELLPSDRRSSVCLPGRESRIPYPLQNHLHALGAEIASQALAEMAAAPRNFPAATTLDDWLLATFGPTLYGIFFGPFHHLYTAGLHHQIAPQDGFKSPVDLSTAIRGAFGGTEAVGYNATFLYPPEGLDVLADRLAESCTLRTGMRVTGVDITTRVLHLEEGSSIPFTSLISTLPLHHMAELCGLSDRLPPADPCTAVAVVNLGATLGPRCPSDHWVYLPTSRAGFHRVGFYSHVDGSFLPQGRTPESHVSIYVEKAFLPQSLPCGDALEHLGQEVAHELAEWGWIGEVEALHTCRVETAYTWRRPGSRWPEETTALLERHGIWQAGRFARWQFQGIAESLREGLLTGAMAAHKQGKSGK